MINKYFSKMLGVLILMPFVISLFAIPRIGTAGHLVPVTDIAGKSLVFYWDLRARKTFFQVTNTDTALTTFVHIQIFNASDPTCQEFNFDDFYSAGDTHIYDVSKLKRNDKGTLSPPILKDKHGFIVVTATNASGVLNSAAILTGNFRIIDDAGYEYRTNAASDPSDCCPQNTYGFNYNNIDGSDLSDIVVISLDAVTGPPAGVTPVSQTWALRLFDEDENDISCSPILLGCGDNPSITGTQVNNLINVGINQFLINSRGGPSLCLGTQPSGHMLMLNPDDDANFNVGFIGLNSDIDGTGSMDVWSGVEDGVTVP